jgi:hypothetical protein
MRPIVSRSRVVVLAAFVVVASQARADAHGGGHGGGGHGHGAHAAHPSGRARTGGSGFNPLSSSTRRLPPTCP